jgi:hypothetical protein
MADLSLWIALILLAGAFGGLAVVTARRVERAHRSERLFLHRRARVLRAYHRRRDGRTYDPDRNPEFARMLGHGAG